MTKNNTRYCIASNLAYKLAVQGSIKFGNRMHRSPAAMVKLARIQSCFDDWSMV